MSLYQRGVSQQGSFDLEMPGNQRNIVLLVAHTDETAQSASTITAREPRARNSGREKRNWRRKVGPVAPGSAVVNITGHGLCYIGAAALML